MNKTFLMVDESGNAKGIDYEPWGGFENFLRDTSNGAGGMNIGALIKRVQPWLYKAVDMTANAVSDLPFDLMKNGEIYDTSADWQNRLGGMPNPKRLLYQLASSLCYGKAYVIPTVLRGSIVDLRYIAPHTVSYTVTTDGLQWFARASDFGNAGIYYPFDKEMAQAPAIDPRLLQNLTDSSRPLKDVDTSHYAGGMMYFWLPDADIEIGVPKSYPIGAALMSAQIVTSADQTLKTYGERGFVPPTILATKGMANPSERQKAEDWWNSFLRRFDRTVAKIMNADTMDIKQVGAGFEQLRGAYREITTQQIENIGAAFGIPAAVFMSDKSFASEIDQLTRIWYSSSVFMNMYHTIEETMTDQLLNRFGVSMKFRPETIDAFQQEEASRANSFKIYVDARIKRSVAAQMVGLELPAGVEYEDLDDDAESVTPDVNVSERVDLQNGQNIQPAAATEAMKPTPQEVAQLAKQERKAFRMFAKNRVAEGKVSEILEFEFKYLTQDEQRKAFAEFGQALPEDAQKVIKALEIAVKAAADIEKI
jgi:hypothetical protein